MCSALLSVLTAYRRGLECHQSSFLIRSFVFEFSCRQRHHRRSNVPSLSQSGSMEAKRTRFHGGVFEGASITGVISPDRALGREHRR